MKTLREIIDFLSEVCMFNHCIYLRDSSGEIFEYNSVYDYLDYDVIGISDIQYRERPGYFFAGPYFPPFPEYVDTYSIFQIRLNINNSKEAND